MENASLNTHNTQRTDAPVFTQVSPPPLGNSGESLERVPKPNYDRPSISNPHSLKDKQIKSLETKLQRLQAAMETLASTPNLTAEAISELMNTSSEIIIEEQRDLAKPQLNPLKAESETLEVALSLSDSAATLKKNLEAAINSAANTGLHDKKKTEHSFQSLLRDYNELRVASSHIEETVRRALKDLKPKPICPSFTIEEKKYLASIGVSIQQVEKQEAFYIQTQTYRNDTYNALLSQWEPLLVDLNASYKYLALLEVLKDKDDAITHNRYVSEYNVGRHSLSESRVVEPNLIPLPDRSSTLDKLELLDKGIIAQLAANAVSLLEASEDNPSKNVGAIETKYFDALVLYQDANSQMRSLDSAIKNRTKELRDLIQANTCRLLKAEDYKTLGCLKMNLDAVKQSEEIHQNLLNKYKTELNTIEKTWQRILRTTESACLQLNQVIGVINTHAKTSYLVLEPIIATPKVKRTVEDCMQTLTDLILLVNADIETARNSKGTKLEIEVVRRSYHDRHHEYTTKVLSDYPSQVDRDYKNERERLEQAIPYTTADLNLYKLPPIPEGFIESLIALGKALGEEPKYQKKADKHLTADKLIREKYNATATKLENLQQQQKLFKDDPVKYLEDRLKRLAQAYKTGILPYEFRADSFPAVPDPQTLTQAVQPKPSDSNKNSWW